MLINLISLLAIDLALIIQNFMNKYNRNGMDIFIYNPTDAAPNSL